MQKEYKTVYAGGEGEIIEKKSRFIATVRPVESEEEALLWEEEPWEGVWAHPASRAAARARESPNLISMRIKSAPVLQKIRKYRYACRWAGRFCRS